MLQMSETEVYTRGCNTKAMIEILNNYAIDMLLQYYQKSMQSEYISIISENKSNIVKYFTDKNVDGNVFYNQSKDQFVINVVEYIKMVDADTFKNNINKLKKILSTLYRIINNYETYLNTSVNTPQNKKEEDTKLNNNSKENNSNMHFVSQKGSDRVENRKCENPCNARSKICNALKYYHSLDIKTSSGQSNLMKFWKETYPDLLSNFTHLISDHDKDTE
eukprot:311412_1